MYGSVHHEITEEILCRQTNITQCLGQVKKIKDKDVSYPGFTTSTCNTPIVL